MSTSCELEPGEQFWRAWNLPYPACIEELPDIRKALERLIRNFATCAPDALHATFAQSMILRGTHLGIPYRDALLIKFYDVADHLSADFKSCLNGWSD